MNSESFVLHKFRAINKHLIESLVSQSLYFAKPSTLNDPFDCRIDLRTAFKRAELSTTGDRKKFFSSLSKPKFFERWQSTLDNVGVCSFSRENQSTLLWSRYGDEHRGLCLKCQFRASHFLTEEFHLTTMGNVEYLDEPLTEWLKSAPMDITKFVKELAHKYLKTKSLAWAYEQESRIIRPKHGVFSLSEPFMNQICFGLRTPHADIDLITNLAQRYTRCTKFSRMVRDETEFGFTEKAL